MARLLLLLLLCAAAVVVVTAQMVRIKVVAFAVWRACTEKTARERGAKKMYISLGAALRAHS